jgi:peptidase E
VASKVLLVFFAKDEEKIPAAVERVKSEFNANKKDKNLSFEIATKDNLLEQIKAADIVYFSGGHTTKLIEDLKQFPHLTEALKGKIVAGESAGANAWSVFCYSPKTPE